MNPTIHIATILRNFKNYNLAVFPMQAIFYLISTVVIYLTIFSFLLKTNLINETFETDFSAAISTPGIPVYLGAFQIVAGWRGRQPAQTAVVGVPTDHSLKTIATIWDAPVYSHSGKYDFNCKY